jgi:tetratricopeptide (TPR) repeat protein
LYFVRALIDMRRSDFDRALADARQARDLAPDKPRYHTAFVDTLLNCGRVHMALDEATTALDRFPQCVSLYGSRAQANLRLGNTKAAAEDAQHVIQIKPTESSSHLLMAHCRVAEKQYCDAALEYQTAVSLVGKDETQRIMSPAARELSRLLSRCPDAAARNGEEALRLAQGAPRGGPYMFEQNDILASAYAELGQFDKAVEAQERAVKSAKGGPWFDLFSKRLALYKEGKPCRETKFDR